MIDNTKRAILKAIELIDSDRCTFRHSTKLKRAIAVVDNVVACVSEYPQKYDAVACTVHNLSQEININYILDNLNKQSDITFKVETDELPELMWHNGHFGMVTNYINVFNISSYSKHKEEDYLDIKNTLQARLQERISNADKPLT